MGQPARKRATSQQRTAVRLRLVEPARARAPRRAPSARARAQAEEARARSLFTMFMTVLLLAVAIGGARVTLLTRAAEYSIGEKALQAEIKEERVEADRLEIDRSMLSTPSRIAGIAASRMHMSEPKSVRYMSMAEVVDGSAPRAGRGEAEPRTAGPLAGVIGAVMELSAGEAQSLLVGDLGLAGSR